MFRILFTFWLLPLLIGAKKKKNAGQCTAMSTTAGIINTHKRQFKADVYLLLMICILQSFGALLVHAIRNQNVSVWCKTYINCGCGITPGDTPTHEIGVCCVSNCILI